ncbi:MAG TPA: hypothetical protein PLL30_10435 [Candidatus Krumholzibacteria bacterium]|nr:hypothetical protein [Candidatus Krumholzibacteria bacterium]HPD72179.1 hypothetical protein [Candidatus Krumholzibacteria bacterium]HRY40889.1 hypothetical protein [Candidatus Krumholzibacteria bacterium]
MVQFLIGGDERQGARLAGWLDLWGFQTARLDPCDHPACVPADRARAVLYACGPDAPPLPQAPRASVAVAPLVVVGTSPADDLGPSPWLRLPDPGPEGAALAAALRPCLDAATAAGNGTVGFRDFLNHELRTPLTAAGTALQTLALQMERAGGQSLELVDIALRNLRRLEQAVDWACDYVSEYPNQTTASSTEGVTLTDLLEDLDDLDSPQPLTWATGAGDWQAPANLDRSSWRQLLRQVLRAVAYLAPGRPLHLDLNLVSPIAGGPAQGLLIAVDVTCDGETERVQRTGVGDEAEQLRRLLAFTVSPELARRIELRYDVVRLSDHLRLRLMMPLACAEGAVLIA